MYGWSPKQVKEQVYPKDVEVYLRVGRYKKLEEQMMNLVIAHNPHTKEPKALFKELQAELTKLRGIDNSELDREGLQRLKQKMFMDRKKYKK
jgi:hypothetical protein